LTEPVVNDDTWPYKVFSIFTVEFEIALGIWLLENVPLAKLTILYFRKKNSSA